MCPCFSEDYCFALRTLSNGSAKHTQTHNTLARLSNAVVQKICERISYPEMCRMFSYKSQRHHRTTAIIIICVVRTPNTIETRACTENHCHAHISPQNPMRACVVRAHYALHKIRQTITQWALTITRKGSESAVLYSGALRTGNKPMCVWWRELYTYVNV